MVDGASTAEFVMPVPAKLPTNEPELDAMKFAYVKKVEGLLTGRKTVKEEGMIRPLDRKSYDQHGEEMVKHFKEKYAGYDASEVPHLPSFTLSEPYNSFLSISEEEFTVLSGRATNALGELKLLPQLPNQMAMNAILREAYGRVTDPSTKQDIRRLYELTGYSDASLGAADLFVESLLDSPQSLQDYQTVFTKLLGDERRAYLESLPVMNQVSQNLQKIEQYCNEHGIPFKLPTVEEVTYVDDIKNLRLIGPLVEREHARVSPGAIVHTADEVKLDPTKPYFVVKRISANPKDPRHEVLAVRAALATTMIISHESVHFNGKEDLAGTQGRWEEGANELITDFASMNLIAKAGIVEVEEDGIPKKWTECVGYHALMLAGFGMLRSGVMTLEEMAQFGRDQNYKGFITMLDERMKGNPQAAQFTVDYMDQRGIIGPDQYEALSADAGNLNAKKVFSAIFEFRNQAPSEYYTHPGMMASNIRNSLPEWEGKSYPEFWEWYMGTSYKDCTDPVRRARRHELIRKDLAYWEAKKKEKAVTSS